MVYVNSDGTVANYRPWSLRKITDLFYESLIFIIVFFQSLLGLQTWTTQNNKSSKSGSKGSFGYGPDFRPGGGGGGGPNIHTMRDVNPPTVNAGGCPGGGCGL